jgi:hypothetical protein
MYFSFDWRRKQILGQSAITSWFFLSGKGICHYWMASAITKKQKEIVD